MTLMCAVIAGYVWILATDNSFSRIDFGLNPLEAPGVPSYLDSRVNPDSVLGHWVSGDLVVGIRSFMRDEFIGFDRILTGYAKAATSANECFYRTFLPESPLVPIGIDSAGVFLYREEDALLRASPRGKGILDTVPGLVSASQEMVAANPEVTFVFYGVSQWTMTPAAIDAGYRDMSVDAWRSFADAVSPVAAVGELRVDDWSEYFFATDHHWKPRGAYQAYRDISELLSQADPELEITPMPFSERVVEQVEFRGAHSRKSAYVDLREPFRVITTRDHGVTAYVDGAERNDLIAPDDYFPSPPNSRFRNHYALYNGQDYPLIEYRTDDAVGRNLLLFGDSFSNSMEDLLAASFERTYSVDLRYYQTETGAAFDLDRFIDQNRITHVVFLSRPTSVMGMPLALAEKRPFR